MNRKVFYIQTKITDRSLKVALQVTLSTAISIAYQHSNKIQKCYQGVAESSSLLIALWECGLYCKLIMKTNSCRWDVCTYF